MLVFEKKEHRLLTFQLSEVETRNINCVLLEQACDQLLSITFYKNKNQRGSRLLSKPASLKKLKTNTYFLVSLLTQIYDNIQMLEKTLFT